MCETQVRKLFNKELPIKKTSMIKPKNIDRNQKENIQKKLINLLKNENNILFSYLHGSFLNEAFRDIDIGIFLNKNFSKKKVLTYELSLEEKLIELIPFPCDVRVINNAPLSFKFSVIKNGIILFSKDESKRSDFESLTFVKYHDFDFYRNRYLREAIGIKI